MGSFFQVLAFTFLGVLLFLVGCAIILRVEHSMEAGHGKEKASKSRRPQKAAARGRAAGGYQKTTVREGTSGGSKTCPVCSSLLEYGERVHSTAFPGIPNQGRMMHIFGCVYCMDGDRPRRCPVCGAALKINDMLIARLFDSPGRSHVHVLGCNRCRER